MKVKLFGFVAAALMAVMLLPAGSASAAAYGAAWQVSVTYQNVGTAPATVSFKFFNENNGTPIAFSPAGMLAAGASTSLAVGSVSSLNTGFKGSGLLSADQPIVATIVQFASGISNRPLSNGFSSSDGATRQLVASVLKNQFSYTTQMSVQNVEDAPIDVKVDFYAVGATSPTFTATSASLPVSAAKYFDAGAIAGPGASFNGSAVVTAKRSGTSTDAKTVVTVNELQTNGNGSKSFEGSSTSGADVYMASALCKFGAAQYTHSYAVQNADSTNSVTFQVIYKQSGKADVVDGPYTLTPGGKQSIQGCDKLPANAIGSAVIHRTAGTGTLVALGKVNGGGVTSAFLGATTGGAKLALPYVRWSPDANFNSGARQRAFIAVQNIGTGNATNVVVHYIDKDGVEKGTHALGTLVPGGKASSNPSLGTAGTLDSCGRFGEYGGSAPSCLGSAFGGGAYITADSGAQLTGIVRIQSGTGAIGAGEDSNAFVVGP